MTEHDLTTPGDGSGAGFTLRDLLAIGFRHQRIAALCFFGIAAGAILATLLTAPQYRATTKFLVDRERIDPIVSPEANTVVPAGEVTEEEINSEVGLLRSNDVLRHVVTSCGLDQRKRLRERIFGAIDPARKLDQATEALAKDIQVEPGRKSNLIEVSYTSSDPQLAAGVLRPWERPTFRGMWPCIRPPGRSSFSSVRRSTTSRIWPMLKLRSSSFRNSKAASLPS